MAVQKTALVRRRSPLGDGASLLELEMPEGEPLGFCGGQYLIVDSGLPLPGGRVAKRAYSILSSDEDPHRFELAVKRIPGGPASNLLNQLSEGQQVRFSGPWGKFHPGADESPGDRVWLLATDTGITAALGLLHSSRFRPYLSQTHVTWLTPSAEDAFPSSFVRERVPEECEGLEILRAPPVGAGARGELVASLRALAARLSPTSVFLSGDGAVIHGLMPYLLESGLSERRIHFECFFNNPARKAAA